MDQVHEKTAPVPGNTTPLEGIGIGIFALLAGGLLLAETFGVIASVKWFLPLALCVFGAVTVVRILMRRKS